VTFEELDYRYTQEWDLFVKDMKLKSIKMPDDSLLYLSTDLTEPDQLYLAKAFWDQRWSRYVSFTKFWVPMLAVLDMQSRAIAVTNFFIQKQPLVLLPPSYTLLRTANVNHFTLPLHATCMLADGGNRNLPMRWKGSRPGIN